MTSATCNARRVPAGRGMTQRPPTNAAMATNAEVAATYCPIDPFPMIGNGCKRKTTREMSAATARAIAAPPRASDSRPRSLDATHPRQCPASEIGEPDQDGLTSTQ